MLIIKKDNLNTLLKIWSENFNLAAPENEDGIVSILPYNEEAFTMDYINTVMSAKEFVFPQKETLFNWSKKDNKIEIEVPEEKSREKNLIFGIRPCDAYGIAYMDKFFMNGYRDNNYAARREKAYFVAVNCVEPGKNCFCNSTGTGPFAASVSDLVLTPVENEYLVEIVNEKGEELVSLAPELFEKAGDEYNAKKEKLLEEVEKKFVKRPDLNEISEIMEKTFDNEIWKKISKECIGCTGCTNVCPTCTCFNVVEEISGSDKGSRVRCWDSCQSSSFTRNAGGHNPRDAVSRVRYRIFDKLKYIEDKFEMKGCTGCGRCIDVCPALIDMTDVVAKLRESYDPVPEEIIDARENSSVVEVENRTGAITIKEEPVHEHNCESVYKPQVGIIKGIIPETKDIKRFIVQYEDKSLHKNYKFSGQFFEITVFGVGEIAISIPFGPSQSDYFDFCIKSAGKVTEAMHNLKVGDKIGLRGPFGKGFPYEEIKGRDLLIVGSGVGIAPVRTMIVRALENRQDFRKIVIIASAQSYEGLIYKYDLIKWGVTEGVDVKYALSKPTDMLDAHVGYINDLLPGLGLDWENTTAILCASPSRIKSVARDLMNMGMKPTDIITTLETHMRCGIGKCGHCKVGSKYMCVDGPVFNYEEMMALPPEY